MGLFSKIPKPPGPKGSSILGVTIEFAADPLGFITMCRDKYRDLAYAKIAFKGVYILLKPEYIQYVLQNNFKNYKKGFAYKGLREILGKGLLTSEGDFWLKQRRIAQPAFHKERLAGFLSTMNQCAERSLQSKEIVDGSWTNMTKHMLMLAQQMVSQCLFSTNVSVNSDKLASLLEAARDYANDRMMNPLMPPFYIPTSKNKKYRRSLQELDQLIYGIIKQRMDEGKKYDDLLNMLMETKDEDTGEKMSPNQLRDEIITIFIAGQETTANALCFIFYLLATHPEVERKLMEEIKDVLNSKELNPELLNKLCYSQMIVKEALRLYPPAWAISRTTINTDNIGGYEIPRGTTLFLSIYAMQRNPEVWNNPDSFIPERFLSDNYGFHQKKAYMPFGAGPRICIGNNFAMMEMQTALVNFYRRYQPVLSPDFKPSLKTPITMNFKNDLYMKFKKRK